MVPALLLMLVLGPMEEFGWRGVALPLLQRKFRPIGADLILSILWATWHLPAFFLSGTPQSQWSFPMFFIGVVSISWILTPLFNAARGSILIAAIYHFQMNNPIWPDAQPYDSLLFAVIAVLAVLVNRRAMFSRSAGVTSVLMPGDEDALPAAAARAMSPRKPNAAVLTRSRSCRRRSHWSIATGWLRSRCASWRPTSAWVRCRSTTTSPTSSPWRT